MSASQNICFKIPISCQASFFFSTYKITLWFILLFESSVLRDVKLKKRDQLKGQILITKFLVMPFKYSVAVQANIKKQQKNGSNCLQYQINLLKR